MTSPSLASSALLVVTRFSFLGQSGWKSEASRDAELLFAPDRLAQRLALFQAVTLPQLSAQSDPDFHHLILTSESLPDWCLTALETACAAAYGAPGRYTILAAAPAPARRRLREFMSARRPRQPVIQVVLDDDDGLATDFIALTRSRIAEAEAGAAAAGQPLALPFFLSWNMGYGLSLRGAADQAALYRHRYDYINAGLTMISPAEGKNIFAIDHRKDPQKAGAALIAAPLMFLRSLHEFNDSRVAATARWQEVTDWAAEDGLASRFPCLFAASAPWRRPGAAPGT